jgi:hypothetical protein
MFGKAPSKSRPEKAFCFQQNTTVVRRAQGGGSADARRTHANL